MRVAILEEGPLAAIAALGHVMRDARKDDTRQSGHDSSLSRPIGRVQEFLHLSPYFARISVDMETRTGLSLAPGKRGPKPKTDI